MRELLPILQGSKMFHSVVKKTINVITDWLIALLVVSLILWFAFTLPVFSKSATSTKNKPLNISQIKLKKHVEALTYYYAPRTIEYGTLNATARYIHKELEKIGHTEYQPFWTMTGRYSNVILKIGPDTKEILVIGAHYDAKNASLDIDGNASGIAALIELARHLSLNKDKLSIGVELAAYPLSQKKLVSAGNMGSYQHADSLIRSNKKVKLMVSLDNVGTFSEEKKSQKYPYQFMSYVYPNTGKHISLFGRLQDYSEVMQLKKSFISASELPLYSFNLPENYFPIASSDHLNFQHFGIPAMVITDTSEYRTIKINKEEVAERLNYQKIAMLVKGLYQVVMDNESALKHAGLAQQSVEPELLDDAL